MALADIKTASLKERERIIGDLRPGLEQFHHTLVNVKASDVLTLIYWIDELRGKEPPQQ